jgi:cell division septum initiation protein DivIVA
VSRLCLLLACTLIFVLGAPVSAPGQSRPSAKPLWDVYPLDPTNTPETEQPPEQPASESPPSGSPSPPAAAEAEAANGGPPALLVAALVVLGVAGAALALVILTRLAPGVVPAGRPAVLRPREWRPRDAAAEWRDSVAGAVTRRVAAFTSTTPAPEPAPEALKTEAEEAVAAVKAASERTLATVRTEAERAVVSLQEEASRSVAESAPRTREAARDAARAAIESEMEQTIASIRAAADEAIDSLKADADRMRLSLREEASETLASIRTEAQHAGAEDADAEHTPPPTETTAERTRRAMRDRVEETLAAMQARVGEATASLGDEEADEPAAVANVPAQAADVVYEECEIAWWHGRHRAYFFARAATLDGSDVGRSPSVRWSGDEAPPRFGPVAAAHEALVLRLTDEGWEPFDQGEAWYAQRLRRPLRR